MTENKASISGGLRRYHKRRADAILQLGGKCNHCGLTENLNFDHIDAATKEFDIGQLLTAKKSKLPAELAKCQLLCTSCHKIKTALNKDIAQIGILNPASKLTEAQVIEARSTYMSRSKEFGVRALAKKYGVSHATMQMAISRKTWKHI